MAPLALGGLGAPELIIILIVVLLLFGGSRLAGLGKSSGRALREFKEETKGLRDKDGAATDATAPGTVPQAGSQPVTPEPLAPTDPGYQQPPRSQGYTGETGDVRRDV